MLTLTLAFTLTLTPTLTLVVTLTLTNKLYLSASCRRRGHSYQSTTLLSFALFYPSRIWGLGPTHLWNALHGMLGYGVGLGARNKDALDREVEG